MAGVECVIVVSGELDGRFDQALAGLTLEVSRGTSELRGPVRDQAELQGVLRQLFDLGLSIVSVTTSPESSGGAAVPSPG